MRKKEQVLPVIDGNLKNKLYGWLSLSCGLDHCLDIVKLFEKGEGIDSFNGFFIEMLKEGD